MSAPNLVRRVARKGFEEDEVDWNRVRRSPWVYRVVCLGVVPPRDFVQRASRVGLYLRVAPYTLLSYEKFSMLFETLRRFRDSGVPGNVVECGVWNGGSAGVLIEGLSRNGSRQFWLFDSWEGVPPPSSPVDRSAKDRVGVPGLFRGSQQVAEDLLFRQLRADRARTHLVRGWFEATLPRDRDAVGPVAVLHIDCDYHDPVRLCLETFYGSINPGGLIIVDDYEDWQGCKLAVDEFLAKQRPRPRAELFSGAGLLIQKPAAD
jgi:O-methyltransferase